MKEGFLRFFYSFSVLLLVFFFVFFFVFSSSSSCSQGSISYVSWRLTRSVRSETFYGVLVFDAGVMRWVFWRR